MKRVKSGSDISFSFNIKVTDKTTVDEIIREASDIIKVRFAEYKVEPEESEDERMMRVIGLALTDVPEERFVSLGTTLKDCLSYLEKQKEQKPAEKQDYSGLTDLERAIHRGFLSAGVENVPVTIIKETANECKRTQTIANENANAEWSEEDKGILLECISVLQNIGHWLLADKLKSLRPQPHWKPSEKQEEPEYYQHFDPDC